MTTATETTARKYLETKSDDELRRIVAAADDRYLPVSATTRAVIDWNGAAAREILAARA